MVPRTRRSGQAQRHPEHHNCRRVRSDVQLLAQCAYTREFPVYQTEEVHERRALEREGSAVVPFPRVPAEVFPGQSRIGLNELYGREAFCADANVEFDARCEGGQSGEQASNVAPMAQRAFWLRFLVFVLLNGTTGIPSVSADRVNVTVDDSSSDIVYAPLSGWNLGNDCSACTAHPDASMARGGTWHDTSFPPNGTFQDLRTASLEFTGNQPDI